MTLYWKPDHQEISFMYKGKQVSSAVEVSPHNPRVVSSNLGRACDRFPELIISILSDASHLYLVKQVSYAS